MGSAEEAERTRVEESELDPEIVAALSCRGRDVGGGFTTDSSCSWIESTCRNEGLVGRLSWSDAVGTVETSAEMVSLREEDWREVFLPLKRALSLLRAFTKTINTDVKKFHDKERYLHRPQPIRSEGYFHG